MIKLRSLIASLAGIVVAVLLPANVALADDVSYKQLSGEWWQWMLSIPVAASPLIDPTGDKCMVGQRGTNWFLAGTFGGDATRTCSIPEGVTLFFPVLNYVAFDTPNQCGQGDPIAAEEYRKMAAQFIDGAANLSVSLDGYPAGPMHRVQSKVFSVALPGDSLFSFCLPAGIYSPAVDDGIYVRIDHLSVGAHTLRIHGEIPSAVFSLDVTYMLDVVPVVLR